MVYKKDLVFCFFRLIFAVAKNCYVCNCLLYWVLLSVYGSFVA